jgi:hypothetical protein
MYFGWADTGSDAVHAIDYYEKRAANGPDTRDFRPVPGMSYAGRRRHRPLDAMTT